MVNFSLKFLVLLALLAISQTSLALTKVTASIDANPVMSNESIILTVIADDSVERDSLDTTPLLEDFIIARTEISSQTSIVNTTASRTTRWQLVLIPRKTGDLIIPALSVENYHSEAVNVKVIEQGNNKSTQQKNIFFTTELSTNHVYVQQLLTLTIKLHIGVELQRASLTNPSLPNATIEQIGKDIESDGIVNGKRYRIIERTYAITPEQSGEFTLKTPMLSADVMIQSRRRSSFLSFGETKPVNIIGDELTLHVQPIPNNYPTELNSAWLPSERLTLHQEWQPASVQSKNEFKVGEPITRTITLTAAGLAKAQLPTITMDAPVGLKVYPDQAELHSSLTKERLISQKRQNFALVASQPGEYTLPKITINWWNTVTNKHQQAELPEQTITVHPNADSPSTPLNSNTAAYLPKDNMIKKETIPVETPPLIVEKASNIQWLFLILWLLTTSAWAIHIFYLKRKYSLNKNKSNDHKSGKDYYVLIEACKQNNAEQALNLILPWLNSLSNGADSITFSTLTAAVEQLDNEALTNSVNDIQQYLYGKNSAEGTWFGTELLKIIKDINTGGVKQNTHKKFTLNPK